MNHRQAVIALVGALLVVTATMAGGAGANTPTIDTSATDGTATTSEITDGANFANVSGEDNSERFIMQLNITSGEDVDLFVERNDSGLRVHENDSAENVSTDSVGGVNFNLSYTGADIDDLERTLNENVSVDVVGHDADNESNSTKAVIHMDFNDDRTVETIDDTDADPDTSDAPVTTEDLEDTLLRSSLVQSLDFSELDVDDRAINGSGDEVVVVFKNGTVADDAANAVASDAEDGDPIFGMTLVLEGDETTMPIRVYDEEIPDDVDEDDDTYGIYQEGGIGGEDGIEIHVGDDFDDDDEVAVTGILNAGRWASFQHRIATTDFVLGLGLSVSGAGVGADAFGVTSILFVIGAPVARRRPVEEAVVVDEPASPGPDTSSADAEA